jgi:hypothetical protein
VKKKHKRGLFIFFDYSNWIVCPTKIVHAC